MSEISTPDRPVSGQVLPTVWKLLRLRWRITLNSFRHAKTVRKVFTIIGMIGFAALSGLIFWLSWLLLTFLRSPELTQYVGDTTAFINAVPVMIFTAFFLGILLTSFGVLLQALYLSGDMDFLLAAPVPIRAVFITKLLQAVLPNFGLIALLGLPILVGLGVAGRYNLLYYPFVLLMMVMLSLAAAGLAGLLVMLVVRIFPARRVVEVLGFVGAVVSIVCSQSGNLMNYAQDTMNVSSEQATSTLDLLTRLNNPWLPLNWPGQGLVALGEGRWLPGLGLTLLSLGLAAGLFWISLTTAERWYYTGWAGMQVIARKKKPIRLPRTAADSSPRGMAIPWVARWIPAPIRGLIWKDFVVLQRDLRNLSNLVTPLIFGVIYGLMFLRSGGEPPAGRGEAPSWFMDSLRSLMVYGNVGLSLLIGWMLLQRLGGMGFSQEGKNYWLLKSAPISARQMLMAKFVVAYLPALVLSFVFLVAFSIVQGFQIAHFAFSLLVVVMCLGGMTGIQLAFGAAGANFTWEDPRRMNAGNMGCLGMVITVIYVPLNLGMFLGPLFVVALLRLPMEYAYLVGSVLGSGMGLLGTLLPPRLLEARVERLGEG